MQLCGRSCRAEQCCFDTMLMHALNRRPMRRNLELCAVSDAVHMVLCCRHEPLPCWDVQQGKLIRTLKGHAHWVNTLALSTEHALRTGAFDHTGSAPSDPQAAKQVRTRTLPDILTCSSHAVADHVPQAHRRT